MEGKNKGARQSAEYGAKTLAEALRRAADVFGVSVEELEYEILKDTTHSILGLVRTGEVAIRVWLATEETEATEGLGEEPEEIEATNETAETESLVDESEEEEAEYAVEAKGNPPELERVASDVIATLLDKMGVLAAVEVVDRGGKVDAAAGEVSPLFLNLVGDDLGMLIGRRGETLRDLQFLTRIIVSKRLGVWPNLVLDVENYKAKRMSALQALARRMADQVRKTGFPAVLEPMPAHERRIVHLALRDDPDVYTESTGQDEGRKVQILPK